MTSPEIYSKGLKMKLNKQQKNEIIQFIADNYSGYFISLQLPLILKTVNKDKAEEYFKDFLYKFESIYKVVVKTGLNTLAYLYFI